MRKPLTLKTLEDIRSEFSDYWKPPRRSREIPLDDAEGRVLAEDVESGIDLPPFDRSAYDGYAVRAEDTFGAEEDDPAELSLRGEIEAGELPEVSLESGTCVAIATGAVMPEDSDAVVMVEDASEEDGTIEIRRAVSPGKNVYEKGSEIKKGEPVAEAGQRISPQVHGALFAAGVKGVRAFRRPRVGVISSGEELVSSGEELRPGQVYDVNGPAICDSVSECGGRPRYLGIVGDHIPEVKRKVERALPQHDVVITSGGSSVGSKDVIPEAIGELGKPGVIAHGLAQKPGKPTLVAVIDEQPIFGLPGYPVSALMVFDQLVAPYIRDMAAAPEPERNKVRANMAQRVLSARGRRELVPVEIIREGEDIIAHSLREGSGAITSLARASGYIDVSLDREILEEGDAVTVKLFGGSGLA